MNAAGGARDRKVRPTIAFFDYADVFEDFYPRYGVDQRSFATRWAGSGNHAFVQLLQRELGDVIWYEFSLAPEITEARHQWTQCQVKILPSSWLHRHLWRWFYLPKAACRWRSTYPLFATLASYLATLSLPFLREIRRDRPDLLFAQDYANGRFDVLLALAHLLHIPLCAYHAGSRPELYIGGMLKRWTLRRADRLIASSARELDMLAQRFRVPRERLRLILTPIDTHTFRPRERLDACRAAGLDPTHRHVLFVGRLDDRIKRVSALIDAFAELLPRHADALLLIVGDGEDGAALRARAAQHAPNAVHFLGWIENKEQLAAVYSAAECLLLPSLSEGFPSVVGEAMACATPVAASDVGGVSELVVHGDTGWLFAPGDNTALATALAEVLDHPERVAAMRPRARARAEARVSPAVIVAQLRECMAQDASP